MSQASPWLQIFFRRLTLSGRGKPILSVHLLPIFPGSAGPVFWPSTGNTTLGSVPLQSSPIGRYRQVNEAKNTQKGAQEGILEDARQRLRSGGRGEGVTATVALGFAERKCDC